MSTLTIRRISRLTIVGIVFHRHSRIFFLTIIVVIIATSAVAAFFVTLIYRKTNSVSILIITIRVRRIVAFFVFFRLLLRLILLLVDEKIRSEFHNFLKGLRGCHSIHIHLLVAGEGNVDVTEQTQLELKIQAVDEREIFDRLVFEFEQIAVE